MRTLLLLFLMAVTADAATLAGITNVYGIYPMGGLPIASIQNLINELSLRPTTRDVLNIMIDVSAASASTQYVGDFVSTYVSNNIPEGVITNGQTQATTIPGLTNIPITAVDGLASFVSTNGGTSANAITNFDTRPIITSNSWETITGSPGFYGVFSNGVLIGWVSGTNGFNGNGSALTNLNAGELRSGTVPSSRLGSGSANTTTYLRGDGTWAVVATSTNYVANTNGQHVGTLSSDGLRITGTGTNLMGHTIVTGAVQVVSSGTNVLGRTIVTNLVPGEAVVVGADGVLVSTPATAGGSNAVQIVAGTNTVVVTNVAGQVYTISISGIWTNHTDYVSNILATTRINSTNDLNTVLRGNITNHASTRLIAPTNSGSDGQVVSLTGDKTKWIDAASGSGGFAEFPGGRGHLVQFEDYNGVKPAASFMAGRVPQQLQANSGETRQSASFASNSVIHLSTLSSASSAPTTCGASDQYVTSFGYGTSTNEFRIRFEDLPTYAEGYDTRLGWIKTLNSSDGTDGLYVRFNTNDTHFVFVARNNNSETCTTNTTIVAADQWYTLQITVNADATSATLYTDGGDAATIIENIPGTSRSVTHGLQFIKKNGTTARLLYIDYWALAYKWTTSR